MQQAREHVSTTQRLQQENGTLRNETDTNRAGHQTEIEEKVHLRNNLLEKERRLQEETIQKLQARVKTMEMELKRAREELSVGPVSWSIYYKRPSYNPCLIY